MPPRSASKALNLEIGAEVANLRLLRVANKVKTNQKRRWIAECLCCHEKIEISYYGIKTRRANDTINCRKCNPNGAGILNRYHVGMEIAGVLLIEERQRRSNKNDSGKRSWNVVCLECGHKAARNSNRLRNYEKKGQSVCIRCNPSAALEFRYKGELQNTKVQVAMNFNQMPWRGAIRPEFNSIERLAYCERWGA